MKKYVLLTLSIVTLYASSRGQDLNLQVISSAGNSNSQLCFTIGQIACSTISSNSFFLTQGFQQPETTIMSATSTFEETSKIYFYPNPSKSIIYLRSKAKINQEYNISDLNGKVLLSGKSISEEGIDLNVLSSGIYILKVDNESFKIVKQ